MNDNASPTSSSTAAVVHGDGVNSAKRARDGEQSSRSPESRHTTPQKRGKKSKMEDEADATSPMLAAVSPTKRAAIAPIVGLLGAVSARVHAAWSRIGVPGLDREGRWNAFLQQSLSPYIEDYLTVNEAEERNMAAENDQLLRDVFFLCERLEEPCKDAALAHVMDVIRDCTSSRSAKRRGTAAHGAPATAGAVAVPADEGNEKRGTSGSSASSSTRAEEEDELRDLLLMPAFTSFFLSSSDGHKGESTPQHLAEGKSERRSGKVAVALEAASCAIQTAIAQLSQGATHQEVRALLQREHRRLERMADYRLQLLCVLYKQKLLLQRPAAEQAILRAAYAEKYLGLEAGVQADGSAEVVQEQQASGRAQCQREAARSSASTVGSYHSALSSMKRSTRLSLNRQPAGGSAGSDVKEKTVEEATGATEDSGKSATEEELHLFLEASLITDSVDLRGTSFYLPPRPTAATATSNAAAVAADHARQEDGGTRSTVFDVDTSDILQYGRRQDLSLRRIQNEANDILRLITEHNSRMKRQADDEMGYIRELFAVCTSSSSSAMSAALADSTSPTTAHLPTRLADIECQWQQLCASYEQARLSCEKLNDTAVAETGATASFSSSAVSAPTSAGSSCRATRATTAFTGTVHNEDGEVDERRPQSLYLPSMVRRIFTALSFAPILHHVETTRHNLQVDLWTATLNATTATTKLLVDAYAAYYAKTNDPKYAQAPPLEPWAATYASFQVPAPTQAPLSRSRAELAEHLTAAEAQKAKAGSELATLRSRLEILNRAAPLLASRNAILTEQRELQEGSRERLLSKKVNMAKQLLHEEGVRKRIAKELPRIMVQLEEIQTAWDALMASTEGSGEDEEENVQARPELRVDGQSVRELLQQCKGAHTPAAVAAPPLEKPQRTPRLQRSPAPTDHSRQHQQQHQQQQPRSRSATPPALSSFSSSQQQQATTMAAARVSRSRLKPSANLHGGGHGVQHGHLSARAHSRSDASAGNFLSLPSSQLSQRSLNTASGVRAGGGVLSRSASPPPMKPLTSATVATRPPTSRSPTPNGLGTGRSVSRTPPPPPPQSARSLSAASTAARRQPMAAHMHRPPVVAASAKAPAKSVIRRLSPTPKDRRAATATTVAAVEPVARQLSHNHPPHPPQQTQQTQQTQQQQKAAKASSGLRARSMSAFNMASTAFPGPAKYKSSLHVKDQGSGKDKKVDVAGSEKEVKSSRTPSQCSAVAAVKECEMSPVVATATTKQVQDGTEDLAGSRAISISLSRELADAVN